MIGNERQYKIARAAAAEVVKAINKFNLDGVAKAMGSKAIAKTHLQALESERENLTQQLEEYDALKSGVVATLQVASLSELPVVLIKARIAKGWSQKDLAESLELKEQQVQRYEADGYASASFRRLMEVADTLGLEVSDAVRMSVAGESSEEVRKTDRLDWAKFPLREIYNRNWFEHFKGSIKDAESNREELLREYLYPIWKQPMQAFHRKHDRVDAGANEYSLVAWECRILRLANRIETKAQYSKERLTETWLRELVKLSANKDGVQSVKEHLASAGIALVVEPHLPETYLDGAMLMSEGRRPVIGMTLRYDRLDNFWFVLLHELAHLALHSDKSKYIAFLDNLQVRGDEVEAEADRFASEMLLPEKIWSKSIARYVRSVESVNQLAKKLGIGSWIIAGRIRNEAEDYTILRDLVGAGEVRKQFPEVYFGQ